MAGEGRGRETRIVSRRERMRWAGLNGAVTPHQLKQKLEHSEQRMGFRRALKQETRAAAPGSPTKLGLLVRCLTLATPLTCAYPHPSPFLSLPTHTSSRPSLVSPRSLQPPRRLLSSRALVRDLCVAGHHCAVPSISTALHYTPSPARRLSHHHARVRPSRSHATMRLSSTTSFLRRQQTNRRLC